MKPNPPQYRPMAVAIAHDNSRDFSRMIFWGLVALSLILGGLTANARRYKKVSAADLVGKVYGVADPGLGRDNCRSIAAESFSAAPVVNDGVEWMGEAEGFGIDYEGQSPEAEAMARYNRGNVAGYGYIFYFPYEAAGREKANNEQCRFCSALLGELHEMGAVVGANPLTDALFDVGGIYNGSDVQLTLSEYVEAETADAELQAGVIPADRSGQFILIMSVVPADQLQFTAELK